MVCLRIGERYGGKVSRKLESGQEILQALGNRVAVFARELRAAPQLRCHLNWFLEEENSILVSQSEFGLCACRKGVYQPGDDGAFL